MAKVGGFSSQDLDKLQDGVRKLPEALRAEIYNRGLEKAGEIILEYARGSLSEKGLIDTGQLLDSLKAKRVGQSVVEVSPTGTRDRTYKRISGTFESRKSRYRTGKAVRNAEVGFILEYGKHNLKGTHWLSEAAEGAADLFMEIADNIL